ncbi:MAG TPA: cupredoxin domain-containing protein [Thermoanaerobaculia bacterium]|nr:cupredoxin domain-containing protein [Thermoanaerobaculia bacterium]
MTPLEWLAVLGGTAAIAWVNWYFFLARRGTASAVVAETPGGGTQEVTITVQGGYDPAEVHLKMGVPARLVFDRQETSGCSEEVVIPEFGIRKFLPAFQKTTVELRPEKTGSFDFTCGMSMLRGKLVVES